jgi:uncharacterized membrane protein
MWTRIGRWIAPALVTAGALGGLALAWSSSVDYSRHLDRQVHDLVCGFVPGVAAPAGGDEGCRAALYSPYAALFRDRYWGGIPISLFAVGAFSFYAALGIFLLLAGRTASRRAVQLAGVAGLAPLGVSILMAYLSATRVGSFCKTCVGIYGASGAVALGGLLALLALGRETMLARERERLGVDDDADAAGGAKDAERRPQGSGGVALVLACALAGFAAAPAAAYVRGLPQHDAHIGSCGKLQKPAAAELALHLSAGGLPPGVAAAAGGRTAVSMIVDPLCPSCRALHQRLDGEGFLEQLDMSVSLMPLDDACNWMVDRAVHPGACEVSKAVLCAHARGKALEVLEWAYRAQGELTAAAKVGGAKAVHSIVERSFPDLGACMEDKQTARKLDEMLRFAVDNRLPVSTPQLFVGQVRVCDEDTDMGLVYALRRLAPQLRARAF